MEEKVWTRVCQLFTTRYPVLGLMLVIMTHILIRFAVSFHPYSGENTPPKFGDYEAQRHWMEITTNMEVKDWYKNSTLNDLSYWGLDYPPLTAYHSWFTGKFSSWIEPGSVALTLSRGYSTPTHRLFMRTSSIISELLVFFTGLFYYVMSYYKFNKLAYLSVMLAQPALILIDHGHFQYNSVCLGLCVWGMSLVLNGHDLLGSISFTLALNFKQIGLYFAPSFFIYLLSKNLHRDHWKTSIFRIAQIGFVVILTFIICWLPFLSEGLESVSQVLWRIFPINRGLYEDKVANFWCSISPFVKFKDFISMEYLLRLCTVTTLVAMIPSSVVLFLSPTRENFLWNCTLTSLSFYLFSFHVHEKSILFPLLPITMLLPVYPLFCSWFITVATFSMYPLLEHEGLIIPYLVLILLFWYLTELTFTKHGYWKVAPVAAIMCIIHVLPLVLSPPAQYPYLFTITFTTFAFINFIGAYLYGNFLQWNNYYFKIKSD